MSGNLVSVNPTYASIIGYSVEETLKLSYWDITPKTYEEQKQEQLKSLKVYKRYGPYKKNHIHKDGHHVPWWIKWNDSKSWRQGLYLVKCGEYYRTQRN